MSYMLHVKGWTLTRRWLHRKHLTSLAVNFVHMICLFPGKGVSHLRHPHKKTSYSRPTSTNKFAEDGPNELTFRTSLIEEAQYDFRVCTLTLDMFQRQNASYSEGWYTYFWEVPWLSSAAGHRAAGLLRQWNSQKTVYKICCTQTRYFVT